MEVWAHRGASALAPENTLEAFVLALEMEGVAGIELDVHLSADGKLVVCHDEAIDRTSNGKGLIADMTLAELKTFDFSQVEGKDFSSFGACRAPELHEVLALLAPTSKKLNVELKTDKNPYPGIEEQVLAALQEWNLMERTVVSSFNRESVARFKALGSEVEAAFLFYKPVFGLGFAMRAGEWDAIHPRYSRVTPHMVRAAHKRNLSVRVYTVDDVDLARRLEKMGIDAVFSNDPQKLLQGLSR